jgi:hypothetical protein
MPTRARKLVSIHLPIEEAGVMAEPASLREALRAGVAEYWSVELRHLQRIAPHWREVGTL